MANPLIVVFGGTGYLGRHLVQRLLAAGYRVLIAARTPPTGPTPAGSEPVIADILDDAAVSRAIDGATAVINAVSLYVEHPPQLTFEAVHVRAAGQLARHCQETGIPTLIQLSGLNPDPDSRSAYVSARGHGEQEVRRHCPGAIILRPGALFGDGQGLLATLERLTRSPVIPLFGRGETRLQPVHVADVAEAACRVVGQTASRGQTYELGGADTLTYRALIHSVLQRQGRARWLIPVPFGLWFAGAALLSMLPSPPLTRDQLILMQTDNVVGPNARGFSALGIVPRGVTGDDTRQ